MMETIQTSKFKQIEHGAATAILRHEHEAILSVLIVLEKGTNRLKKGQPVPLGFFEDVLEFLTIFADKCHHGKEEEVLFPLMREGGIPVENGPIGQMLAEHDQGRACIKSMRSGLEKLKAGSESGKVTLASGAENYISLLRQHIMKENRVLFMIADSLLQPETQQAAVAQFDLIETQKIGEGTHERLHGLIDKMIDMANQW